MALLQIKGVKELQCELLVSRLLDGKELVPSTKGDQLSDLVSQFDLLYYLPVNEPIGLVWLLP